MAGHYLQTERVQRQCTLGMEKKALLWEEIVRAKIKNQADVLKTSGEKGSTYLQQVFRSSHKDNAAHKEAQAARSYWKHLFGASFQRARFGAPPNAALNYGYSLLRSAMSRAIAAQGLILSLGIHHHNRYNPFALADDMMEPYRPFVDLLVYGEEKQQPYEKILTKAQRDFFITLLLQQKCIAKKESLCLGKSIALTARSYVDVLQNRRSKLFFPKILHS